MFKGRCKKRYTAAAGGGQAQILSLIKLLYDVLYLNWPSQQVMFRFELTKPTFASLSRYI